MLSTTHVFHSVLIIHMHMYKNTWYTRAAKCSNFGEIVPIVGNQYAIPILSLKLQFFLSTTKIFIQYYAFYTLQTTKFG